MKMRNNRVELDVDFIGGQEPLTKEEEKAISEFIRKQKQQQVHKQNRNKTAPQRKKVAI